MPYFALITISQQGLSGCGNVKLMLSLWQTQVLCGPRS
jgi:hypothetical protein